MGKLSKQLTDVGAMDELISIRQFTRTTDATGGVVETPSYLAQDVWALVEEQARSDKGDRGEEQQIVAYRITKFTFRDFWATLNETMRIVYDGDEYDILSISKLGRNRFVIVEAEKRDNET